MIRPSRSKACDGVAGDKPKRARRGARPAARERAPVRARAQADPPAARIAVRLLPVESLTPNERNARLHSAPQVRRIADSIAAFGFNVPVLVDAGGVVLAGHGRLMAAKRLGLERGSDDPARPSHGRPAARLHDRRQRLAERASWDDRRLAVELAGLKSLDLDFALSATGFELKDIELRIGAVRPPPRRGAVAAGREWAGESGRKRAPLAAVEGRGAGPAVARAGDTWALGPHRLACALAPDAGAYLAIDAAIRGWQALSGESARLHPGGPAFEALERAGRRPEGANAEGGAK